MSSRALRKAQRQLEEEQAIKEAEAEAADQSEEEESEAEVAPEANKNKTLFALLNQQDDEDDEEDESSEKSDNEAMNVTPSKPVEPKHSKSAKKKKKKKSKAKSKEVTEPTNSSKEEDDIDAALRALNLSNERTTKAGQQNSNLSGSTAAFNPQLEAICNLLAVNTQNLHVLNEMRRLFGRDALEAERRPAQQEPRPRARGQRGQQQNQQQNQGFSTLSLRRNIFIQGKDTWPRATTGGLGMELVPADKMASELGDGVVEYRFVHSTAYRETQAQYEIAVASMDPQRLVLLLHHNPYHIATLLQVSEICKHERSHTESGDLLERALFTFGRSIHSTFGHKLAQGKARLDFNRPENREFFLAIWRYIQNLTMRGTWRTVYEWAKFLLSMSPKWDPYAMYLVIDQYALRAGQAQSYLDLLATEGLFQRRTYENNWAGDNHVQYAAGLAYLSASQPDKAREALRNAIELQPWLAHRLFKELDLEPIPPALWSYHEPPTPHHTLRVEMYCTRAKDLWNTPEAMSLLSAAASTANPRPYQPGEFGDDSPGESRATDSIAEMRHVQLSEKDDWTRLMLQIPEYLEDYEGKGQGDIGPRPNSDPFPPIGDLVSYDPRRNLPAAPSRSVNELGMYLWRLIQTRSISKACGILP
jgi:chemotaxis protein histidine kinase CheA